MTKQEFRRTVYEHWLLVQVFFKLKMDGLRLSFAISMCNALQKARNKRFYVIENQQGKLVWVCNEDIDAMKKPRRVRKLVNGKLRIFKVSMLPKHTSHLDVMKNCLYYTPTSLNNSDGMSPKERMERSKRWIKYMERIRRRRLYGKLEAKK